MPFRLATCDWDAEAGLVPWKSGTYEVNGFSVTNLALRATKATFITLLLLLVFQRLLFQYNHSSYPDDTTLMAERGELKNLSIRAQEESKKLA